MKNTEVHISTKTIIRFWLIVILLASLTVAIYAARWAIVMILTAIFLALVMNRPVEFFTRKLPGKSRSLGTAITFLITLTVVFGTLTLILPIFVEQTINFARSLPDTIATLQESSKPINDFMIDAGMQEAFDVSVHNMSSKIGEFASDVGTTSVALVGNLVSWIGNAVIVLILTFFMLIEGSSWLNKFWNLAFRNSKKRAYYRSISTKMYNVITGYVSSQLIAAAATGALVGIGVFILSLLFSVPTSLILPTTAIVFVAAFIPLFGGFIGAAVGTLLILLFNPWAALIFALYCTVMMTIFYNILSPKIAGRFMKISALLILISLLIGMQVAGIFGALVAIPVAGCFVVIFREYLKSRDKNKN
jgi:Predicted permease